MADTEKSELPQTNGLENGLDEDERTKLRPADIDADVKEMERRKRVEMIMSSKLFREELERIIELQMKDGNGPAGLLQQISDMMGIQSGKLHTTHMFRGSNCVTPINDIRGVESMGYEKGEKNLRCKLASVFRLMDLYGWSQGINNQITARLNQDEEHFLVNAHGMLYNEITASSLVKVDMQGNIVEPGTTNFTIHTQGFLLHSAIQASRPDVKCVIHIKTPSVLAVSSLKCGLLPLCQEALVIGEVSQHPFICGIFEPEERDKIIRNLGPTNKVLLLQNHGAVCCGATVEEAFYNVYNTVLACETQIKLMPIGIENLVLVSDETRKQVYDAAHRAPDAGDKKSKQFRVGELEFEALIRMLDNAGFRTGYIYRHPLVKGELPKPKNDVEVPPAVSSLGYLIEQEELYKQGNWKKYVDGRNRLDRTKWLNSPNVYQKVEILETGTSDPKKITKWVAESSPTHSSTPVKIDSALQFVPKGTNPKEFKKLQQQIKENRRADKITSGPQSHILEGVSWEEAKKLQDANITQTGDQVILVGAASKGIIQRNYQHNALVYKTPYAKNPFDSMSDKEIEDYKQLIERKHRGDTDYEESQSESEAISSRQDALRHIKSPLLSPQSATSETEEESRDEPRVLRIETKTAPRPIHAEVVLSDAEFDSTDARVERSHSARYPKTEKPESVNLMNSFRKSWSLKREKDKNKDIDVPDDCDSRNLLPSLILNECENDRMESLNCCIARIKQLTHKPVIIDIKPKSLRPILKSASDPCNLSRLSHEESFGEGNDSRNGLSKDINTSFSCNSIPSDLKRRLSMRKKLIYSAKMKFLGLENEKESRNSGRGLKDKTPTSPMCALISEIRETLNEIMSPERTRKFEDTTSNYFDSLRWIQRPKFVPRKKSKEINVQNGPGGEIEQLLSSPNEVQTHPLEKFEQDSQITEKPNTKSDENCDVAENLEYVCLDDNNNDRSEALELSDKAGLDESQSKEQVVKNIITELLRAVNISDEDITNSVTDDSLLPTYSFTETAETEWYYSKTIMQLENSQTVVEIKEPDAKGKDYFEGPIVKCTDTGIDTDFTSEKENCVKSSYVPETSKEINHMNAIEEDEIEVRGMCETSTVNKSSETDSSFLKSSSGRTSNDVDSSLAFKTETESSEKKIHKNKSKESLMSKAEIPKESQNEVSVFKNETECVENVELNDNEASDTLVKKKDLELISSKLPIIAESPEFTNIDTEDAPATSSSKDSSPEGANPSQFTEEETNGDHRINEVEEEKMEDEVIEEQSPDKKKKRKKNKKSSTKITVKKEVKDKSSSEPVVSEIRLTIKNSKPCQSEKYEVKIQDVTNTSEELSSSLGENIESFESYEIVDSSCGCDAQQNLEELQGEVSSSIEKLQTIENYFEGEIKKHSVDEKKKQRSDELTIEYNYGELEDVLNESRRISDSIEEDETKSCEKERIFEIEKPEENSEFFFACLTNGECAISESPEYSEVLSNDTSFKSLTQNISDITTFDVKDEENEKATRIAAMEGLVLKSPQKEETKDLNENGLIDKENIKSGIEGKILEKPEIEIVEESRSASLPHSKSGRNTDSTPKEMVYHLSELNVAMETFMENNKKNIAMEMENTPKLYLDEVEQHERCTGFKTGRAEEKPEDNNISTETFPQRNSNFVESTGAETIESSQNTEIENKKPSETEGAESSIDEETLSLQYLKSVFSRLASPPKALTWPEGTLLNNIPQKMVLENQVSDSINNLVDQVIITVREEPTANDIINFILSNEESPVDSLAEFEDMENIISQSTSIVAGIIDSLESHMEGEEEDEAQDLESLPDEEENLKASGNIKKKKDIFKVTIATPTKKEIFINYNQNSSSTFNLSSDIEFCNSYIKTDDVNEDFENLDVPDFFSMGSPGKNSLNSSYGSACSYLETPQMTGDQFCCNESGALTKSPRSLAIIQEVDEGDSSTSSDCNRG